MRPSLSGPTYRRHESEVDVFSKHNICTTKNTVLLQLIYEFAVCTTTENMI